MVTSVLCRIANQAVVSLCSFTCLFQSLFLGVWFPLIPCLPHAVSSIWMPRECVHMANLPSLEVSRSHFSFETWVMAQNFYFSPAKQHSTTWFEQFTRLHEWFAFNPARIKLVSPSDSLIGMLSTLLVHPFQLSLSYVWRTGREEATTWHKWTTPDVVDGEAGVGEHALLGCLLISWVPSVP